MGFSLGEADAELVSRVQSGGIACEAAVCGADEGESAVEGVLWAGRGEAG